MCVRAFGDVLLHRLIFVQKGPAPFECHDTLLHDQLWTRIVLEGRCAERIELLIVVLVVLGSSVRPLACFSSIVCTHGPTSVEFMRPLSVSGVLLMPLV